MTGETVVTELFARFPELEETYRIECRYLLDEPPMAYIVFGDVLMAELERALEDGDLEVVRRICIFFEDMAKAARKDAFLDTLMGVEVGEWLGFCANEDVLAPWLGSETKLICGYVPGLATQRRQLFEEKHGKSVPRRLRTGTEVQ